MGEIINTLKNVTENRMSKYHLLRKLYISEPLLIDIEELVNISKNYDFFDNNENNSEYRFISYFKSLNLGDLPQLHNEIKVEYARLFIGPRPPLASPFESVYRSSRKVLMNELTMEVRKKYKEMGIQVIEKDRLPDDHIGLELEFMYYLCFKTIEAINESKNIECIIELVKKQQVFIEEHLIQWIPEFCNKIINNSNLVFFKEIAIYTESFINEEKISIEQILDILNSVKIED